MTERTEHRLQVNNGPDIKFVGRLVYEYSTQNKEQTKERWSELRLWETEGGAWIAEKVGCSDKQREVDLVDALVIEPTDGDLDATGELQAGQLAEWRNQVMAFFGWTVVAKAFARKAGWDVVREVA